MGVLLDVLGAIIIGGLLLIMLISFNFQLRQTAERNMYAAQMTEHMDSACMRLNYLIGLAGAGVDPDEVVVTAEDDTFTFQTYWNFERDKLEEEGYYLNTHDPIKVSIKLDTNSQSSFGGAIKIIRHGVSDPVEDMGYIFWVKDLEFRYYDIDDNQVTDNDLEDIRAVEIFLTFERPGPLMGDRPITNNLQLKCYMMNAFMQEGLS